MEQKVLHWDGWQELIVVPVELPVEWDDLKHFKDTSCILSIQSSKNCRAGKRPINIKLDPPVRRGDIALLINMPDCVYFKTGPDTICVGQ